MNNIKVQYNNVSYMLEIERVNCSLIWLVSFLAKSIYTKLGVIEKCLIKHNNFQLNHQGHREKASVFFSRTLRRGSFSFVRSAKYERPSRSHWAQKTRAARS